jgi:hypothetical protein
MGDSCEWRIIATHGEKIILSISHLDIPDMPVTGGKESEECDNNYLEIRKGIHKCFLKKGISIFLRNFLS